MASRSALFILLNILFFTMVTSTSVPCPPTPKTPSHGHRHSHSHCHHHGHGHKHSKDTCPKDASKLGVCGNLLTDLVGTVVGTQLKTPCCTFLGGLADLEAASCLCTAINANVLGIMTLNVSVSLGMILNCCGKKVPSGFQCA